MAGLDGYAAGCDRPPHRQLQAGRDPPDPGLGHDSRNRVGGKLLLSRSGQADGGRPTGPVLVLAPVRGGQAGDADGVQAHGAGVGVELGRRFPGSARPARRFLWALDRRAVRHALRVQPRNTISIDGHQALPLPARSRGLPADPRRASLRNQGPLKSPDNLGQRDGPPFSCPRRPTYIIPGRARDAGGCAMSETTPTGAPKARTGRRPGLPLLIRGGENGREVH
jgi:hypothetical protein